MTRLEIIAALAALGAFAACNGSTHAGPDARGDGDAQPTGGLSLAFSIDPPVPGTILPGTTIDSVSLAIKDLRLTGDAASATDDRTRATFLAIGWSDQHAPYPATFPAAPPGHYSKIAFALEDDSGVSFSINGTVELGGTMHDYVVQDDHSIDVSVPMDVELPIGSSASDTLQVHTIGVLTGVDWSDAQVDPDGTLELTSDSDLSAVRTNLIAAFTAASTATSH